MSSHHAESWVWCSILTFDSQLFGQIYLTHCMKKKKRKEKKNSTKQMIYFTLYVYLHVLPEVFSVSSAGK